MKASQLCLNCNPIWYRQRVLALSREMQWSSTINLPNIECLCRCKLMIEHQNNEAISFAEVQISSQEADTSKGEDNRTGVHDRNLHCCDLLKSLYFKKEKYQRKKTEDILGITFSLIALCGKHFFLKTPVCIAWIETMWQLFIFNDPKELKKEKLMKKIQR